MDKPGISSTDSEWSRWYMYLLKQQIKSTDRMFARLEKKIKEKQRSGEEGANGQVPDL